jgi:Mrp family chromosome partitioning ATPase
MHLAFGEAADPGVSDLLRDDCQLPDAIRYLTTDGPSGTSGLYLLPAGSPATNPSELIGTQRTARLLDTLSQQADIVLIDSPPVLPVADTLVLARIVAGVLLVVNSGSTSYTAATRAKDTLVRNHARILGMVLNRFEVRSGDFQLGYSGSYESAHDRSDNAHGLDRDESTRGNGRSAR